MREERTGLLLSPLLFLLFLPRALFLLASLHVPFYFSSPSLSLYLFSRPFSSCITPFLLSSFDAIYSGSIFRHRLSSCLLCLCCCCPNAEPPPATHAVHACIRPLFSLSLHLCSSCVPVPALLFSLSLSSISCCVCVAGALSLSLSSCCLSLFLSVRCFSIAKPCTRHHIDAHRVCRARVVPA